MTAYDNTRVLSDEKFWDDWVKQISVDEVSRMYTGWEPELLSLLQTSREASRWAIHTVRPLPRFVSGNVALVGDAAYAMTPHIDWDTADCCNTIAKTRIVVFLPAK